MAEVVQFVDTEETSVTEGDLPAQGGGFTPTIMPGVHLFTLPPNIDQLWEPIDVEVKDLEGNVKPDPKDPSKALVEHHLMLKFDRDNPMICADPGGEFEGLPASNTISTVGRKRGKKNDPDAPVVSDMTYFVRKSLNDQAPVKMKGDWKGIVNRHAGGLVRLETGLSAFCDPERKRYISDGAGGVVEDPSGATGCGKGPGGKDRARYYTNAFKTAEVDPETGAKTGKQVFVEHIQCANCEAILRGFFRVERYLEPLASTTQVQA